MYNLWRKTKDTRTLEGCKFLCYGVLKVTSPLNAHVLKCVCGGGWVSGREGLSFTSLGLQPHDHPRTFLLRFSCIVSPPTVSRWSHQNGMWGCTPDPSTRTGLTLYSSRPTRYIPPRMLLGSRYLGAGDLNCSNPDSFVAIQEHTSASKSQINWVLSKPGMPACLPSASGHTGAIPHTLEPGYLRNDTC